MRALTIAWVALLCAAHLWHHQAGGSPPSWDDAWYLEYSFRFYFALARDGLWVFAREYADSFHTKAPLLSVLPLPIYFLTGPSIRAALAVNIPAVLLTLCCVYGIGRELARETSLGAEKSAGLLSLWLCSLMPLLYELPRHFLVETWLSAAVAATVWLLLKSLPARSPIPAKALGLCLGAGLLLKSLYALYAAGPLFAWWFAKRRYAQDRTPLRAAPRSDKSPGTAREETDLRAAAKTAGFIAAALAGTWYAFNWMYALGYAASAGFGAIAKDYGTASPWDPKAILNYWLQAAGAGLGWPLCLLAGAVAAVALRARFRIPGAPPIKPPFPVNAGEPGFPVSWKIVAWGIGLPLTVLTLGVNKNVRFIAPLLPLAAAMLGAALAPRIFPANDAPSSSGGRNRLRRLGDATAFTLLIACSLSIFGRRTFPSCAKFPAPGFGASVVRGLDAALPHHGPPSGDGAWGQERLVERLNEISAGRPAVVAVGVEHWAFNANTLAALSALKNYQLRFISLGYAQASPEVALIGLKERNVSLLLTVRGIPDAELPAFLNRAARPLEERLESGRLPYRKLEERELTPSLTAFIYRKLPVTEK